MFCSVKYPALCVFAIVLSQTSLTRAADHLDAPLLQASGAGERDINDLYAFQSPSNPNNTVLILTVNPFAGQVSGTEFGSTVDYQFQIDNDGDAQADITYSTTFSPSAGGVQTLTTTRNATSYATGSTETDITTGVGGTIRAGIFDDPFFFDLVGFQNGFSFTGNDAFAGANVSAIVLEVPSSELGGPNIGVWARTLEGGQQTDRMGRPAINTVLIPGSRKDEFNQAAPANDFTAFGDDVKAVITSLSDSANADALAPILLPDVLTFDTSSSAGFLNGRQLADDVIDAELNLLSAGGVTTDLVGANDLSFLNVFPYLAPAHVIIPEPTSAVLMLMACTAMFTAPRRRRK